MQSGLNVCLAPSAENFLELRDEHDGSGFDSVDFANLFRFTCNSVFAYGILGSPHMQRVLIHECLPSLTQSLVVVRVIFCFMYTCGDDVL